MKRLLSSLMTKFRMRSLRETSSPVNDPFPHQCGTRQILSALALAVLMTLCFAGNAVAEGKPVEAKGTLTSVEKDGTVIIDGAIFELARSARVLNANGKRVKLNELRTPAVVKFEYQHTPQGPIITRLKERGE